MAIKLFDSELKVMGVLWREGDCTAKHISDVLAQETGWKMNTTYTLIKRCIGKGAVQLPQLLLRPLGRVAQFRKHRKKGVAAVPA